MNRICQLRRPRDFTRVRNRWHVETDLEAFSSSILLSPTRLAIHGHQPPGEIVSLRWLLLFTLGLLFHWR